MPSRPPAETLPTPGRVPLWPPRYLSSCGLFPASLPLSTSHSPSFQGQASTKSPVASRPDLLTCQSSPPPPAPVSTSPSESPWLRTRDPMAKPRGAQGALGGPCSSLACITRFPSQTPSSCHRLRPLLGAHPLFTRACAAGVLRGVPAPVPLLDSLPGVSESPLSGILSPQAVVRFQATQQEVSKRSSPCIRRRAPAPAPPPQPHPRSSGVRLPGALVPGARKAGAQRPT